MITCKCPHCGKEINPASLLGKGKKKTMTPEAVEQRKKAGQASAAKRKEKSEKQPV